METKLNEGVIFKNDKKPEGSKQPDYRGNIDCDGVKKEIALWIREAKESGKKYFSVKISEPCKKPAEPPESDYQKIPPKLDEQPDSDSLPF
jgi:uncharacterized protein (DUF736 family)